MSCTCKPKDKTKWLIRDFRCNYSAFNGYHRTTSDYSCVMCTCCGSAWRTKAAYVLTLKHA